MTNDWKQLLLPKPWSIDSGSGSFALGSDQAVEVSEAASTILSACLGCYPASLHEGWQILSDDSAGHWLAIGDPDLPEASSELGSYRLIVGGKGVALVAWTVDGFRSGVHRLLQMVRSSAGTLPEADIQDSPAQVERPVRIPAGSACCAGVLRRLLRDAARYRLNKVVLSQEPSPEVVAEAEALGMSLAVADADSPASALDSVPYAALLGIAASAHAAWTREGLTEDVWKAFAFQQFGIIASEAGGLISRLYVAISGAGGEADAAGLGRSLEQLGSGASENSDQFDCLTFAALAAEHATARRDAIRRALDLAAAAAGEGSAAPDNWLDAAAHALESADEGRASLNDLGDSIWRLHHDDGCASPRSLAPDAELAPLARALRQLSKNPESEALTNIKEQLRSMVRD